VVGVGEAGKIGPCPPSKPRDISSISLHHVSTRTTDARERRYTLVLCLALLTWLPSIGQTNEVLSAKVISSRGPDLGVYLMDAGLLLSSARIFHVADLSSALTLKLRWSTVLRECAISPFIEPDRSFLRALQYNSARGSRLNLQVIHLLPQAHRGVVIPSHSIA
jgi:hypothetical protein